MSSPAPKIINLTPHAVALNDGTVFPPDGTVARVAVTYVRFLQPLRGTSIPLYTRGLGQTALLGLPPPAERTYYIVSAALAEAAKPLHRPDLLVPATGHPAARRDDHGQIISVPGFLVP